MLLLLLAFVVCKYESYSISWIFSSKVNSLPYEFLFSICFICGSILSGELLFQSTVLILRYHATNLRNRTLLGDFFLLAEISTILLGNQIQTEWHWISCIIDSQHICDILLWPLFFKFLQLSFLSLFIAWNDLMINVTDTMEEQREITQKPKKNNKKKFKKRPK